MTKRGFTLIELLVVIGIIGILSGIIIPNLNTAKESGRDAKRVADIKNIQVALALYYNDNLKYPNTTSSLAPTYMSTVPTDPQPPNSPYPYTALVAAASCSGSLACTAGGGPARYHLGAGMEQAGSSLLGQDDDRAENHQIGTQWFCVCDSTGQSFHGDAPKCAGTTAASPDSCYDVVP